MSLDPYQPCPACVGTDKKVKFCCSAIVPRMEKVARLQETNQAARAIEELRSLHDENPGNAWVATSLAAQLMDEAEIGEARELLHGVLREHPDHPFALALLATLAFAVEGYDDAKPVIHRALQKAAPVFPGMMARVVVGIASEQLDAGRVMSAREHLALGLRLVRTEEDQREVFEELLRFEGDPSVAYPLRSVHQFATFSGEPEEEAQHLVAMKLSYLGLWEEAAGVLSKIAEAHPEDAAVQQNLGFCHAWDGNLAAAATALHRAAELQADAATAVELETIAQLLDLETTEDTIPWSTAEYEVESVAKLLSELEEGERIVRLEMPESGGPAPAGLFYVLDRPKPAEPLPADAMPEDVPKVLGRIALFATDPESGAPPRGYVGGLEGEPFEAVKAAFEAIATDSKPVERDENAPADGEAVPAEWEPLNWHWHLHDDTPVAVRREIEQRQWQHVVEEVFPNTKFAALGGRSPLEAKDDPSTRTATAALLAVFEGHCDRNEYEFDVAAVRERLGLEAPAAYVINEEVPLNSLSSMQLARIPVEELPDEQLTEVVNRALLIRHGGFLRRLLVEILNRPSCRQIVDVDRCHQTLAELARNRNDLDEAVEWIRKGREAALADGDDFETNLRWHMLELRFRVEKLDDPDLRPLLEHMWSYFGGKLPNFKGYLHELVVAAGIDPPWDANELVAPEVATAGTTSAGGVWTPGAEPPAEEGGGKLWVPGQ